MLTQLKQYKHNLRYQTICKRYSSFVKVSQETVADWNERYNGFISLDRNANEFNVDPVSISNSSLNKLSIAVKDNIWTKDFPTTCASKMLENYEPAEDATVVRLLREKGAHIMGKTNMDEFGMGSANSFSYFGATLNPHPALRSSNHVPGGSSGGSAAAVKSGLCHAALGSDTGGSVRLPAAYCGVVGFKPSYGCISRYGLIPYASSLDTIGVLARDVFTADKVFSAISGMDPLDATSRNFEKKFGNSDIKAARVGIPSEYMLSELEDDVKLAWRSAIKQLCRSGAKCIPVSLPNTKLALAAYYLIALSEAASNLARYDGVRYGYRPNSPESFADLITTARDIGFGQEVQRRILMGTYALTSGAIDDYYYQAQRVRRAVKEDFDNLFSTNTGSDVDFLLTPTSIGPAPHLHHKTKNTAASFLNDVFTVPASLAGLPAISVPWSSSSEIPIGLQLIAPYGHDKILLYYARQLEELAGSKNKCTKSD